MHILDRHDDLLIQGDHEEKAALCNAELKRNRRLSEQGKIVRLLNSSYQQLYHTPPLIKAISLPANRLFSGKAVSEF